MEHGRDITIDTRYGTYLLPNIVEIISFDLFINGAYERGLVKRLKKAIPRGGVFIDVGANIGSICIPLALGRPDIKIIALEASPWIFEVLESNLKLNEITNIFAFNYAVYEESGKDIEIFAPRELFGKGSLKPIFTSVSECVRTITIDDVVQISGVENIHFVKVDVEGFEASVFKGMGQTFSKNEPNIIFEFSEQSETSSGFSPGEAQRVLISHGYQIQRLNAEFELIGSPHTSPYLGTYTNLYAFKS